VGKSTCSANLACALTHLGAKVALLDCDIYGPSIPLMMGVTKKRPSRSRAPRPPSNHGVKVMSIGLLVTDDQPVIWAGPMITKTIHQFLLALMGDLDFLLVDLPPGTGDAQLSLLPDRAARRRMSHQHAAGSMLGVVRKGIADVPESERADSWHRGKHELLHHAETGERVEIFGHGGGKDDGAGQNVPFLGEVPIFTEIREGRRPWNADCGFHANHAAARHSFKSRNSAETKLNAETQRKLITN